MTRQAHILAPQDSPSRVAIDGAVMAAEEVVPVVTAEADLWKQQFKHMLGGPYSKVRSDRRKIYYVGGISFCLIAALVAVSIYYWASSTDALASTFPEQKEATASMLAVLPLEDLLAFRTARLPVSAEETSDFDIFSITRIGQDEEQITIAELSDHHTLTIKDGGMCTLFSDSNSPLYQWTASPVSGEEIDRPPVAGLPVASPGRRRSLARKSAGGLSVLSDSRKSSSSRGGRHHKNDLRTYMDHLPQAMGAAMYPFGVNPFNVPGYDFGPILSNNPGPPLGPHPFTVDLLRAGWPGPPFRGTPAETSSNYAAPERAGLSGGMGGDGRSPGRGWGATNNFDVIPVTGS
eukprot:GHVS01100422.1.p1 GENE.GHVS01100422.1~~GHVS01100422.1.p1  ORF type:complete len:348 (+),score=46.63 GHVS01100422.1:301-1344(+)